MTHILITTGPESCGKTTLATQLSAFFQAPLVSEASRDYLNGIYRQQPGYRYQQQDLLEIARIQYAREQQALQSEPPHLVCDTDLLVIVIWSEVKYGHCAPKLIRLFEQSLATSKRSYLLCDHHIPWQHDPLRENPYDRDKLFNLYQEKLDRLGASYLVASGNPLERMHLAQRYLSSRSEN